MKQIQTNLRRWYRLRRMGVFQPTEKMHSISLGYCARGRPGATARRPMIICRDWYKKERYSRWAEHERRRLRRRSLIITALSYKCRRQGKQRGWPAHRKTEVWEGSLSQLRVSTPGWGAEAGSGSGADGGHVLSSLLTCTEISFSLSQTLRTSEKSLQWQHSSCYSDSEKIV